MDNKRLLIVDGDPIQARVLTRSLRLRRFDAVSVRNPETALAEAADAAPDYVIVEQQLPGASGLALIRPLKNINPAARIMVLTAYPSIERAVDSIKLGACNYLAKPAYPDEILAALGIDAAEAAACLKKKPATDKTHSLADLEWKHILRALDDHGGNVSAAARELKMHRRTLQRKLEDRQAKSGRDVAADIRESRRRQHRIEMRRAYCHAAG